MALGKVSWLEEQGELRRVAVEAAKRTCEQEVTTRMQERLDAHVRQMREEGEHKAEAERRSFEGRLDQLNAQHIIDIEQLRLEVLLWPPLASCVGWQGQSLSPLENGKIIVEK